MNSLPFKKYPSEKSLWGLQSCSYDRSLVCIRVTGPWAGDNGLSTLAYFMREEITVWPVSGLACYDSVALLQTNDNIFSCLVESSQTEDVWPILSTIYVNNLQL